MSAKIEKTLAEYKAKILRLHGAKSPELKSFLEEVKKVTPTKMALKTSGVGITINKIGKDATASEEVKKLCKDILSKWKDDVSRPDAASPSVLTPTFVKAEPKGVSAAKSEHKRPSEHTPESDGLEFDSTNDKLRDKSICLLYTALRADPKSDPVDTLKYVIKLEEYTHADNKLLDAYKARIRTLSFNLRDPNNPDLREWVNSGDIPVKRLSQLTTEEMASQQRKDEVEKLKKEALNEIISAGDTQAETDMFKCGKCGKRKCKYFQMQTRSADEPMTTFVTCVHCGNKWKFC